MSALTDTLWEQATAGLEGAEFGTPRKPDTPVYRVLARDRTGLTVERPKTGSTSRLTRVMVSRAYERLLNGQSLKARANGKQGGISYTVSVEAAAVLVLKNLVPNLRYNTQAGLFEVGETGA